MPDFFKLARPFLFTLDPEDAHGLTIKALRSGALPGCTPIRDASLHVTLWGIKFPNPVGLAAGFDKNAEVIGAVLKMGFGFAEAGTVTPKPQEGNPRPRIFREAEHEAVINRMGFPNQGMNVFKDNLERFLGRRPRAPGVVGINIGMNKDQDEPAKDYCQLIRMLGPMADYLSVNISSPNTPGLRDLQRKEPLRELLAAIQAERAQSCGSHPPPLLVKFAPDLEDAQQEELAECVMETKVDGIILTNTTLARPDVLPERFRDEKGGLSGKPLDQMSTAMIGRFYTLTKGQIPIIGVGGVSSGADAYEKIKAGASLVQLYSSLVFQGPNVANSINKELIVLLKRDGFSQISEAVGTAHA